MTSIWTSHESGKNGNLHGTSQEASRTERPSSRRDYDNGNPDERTRLLQAHQPPNSDGYLDPDDPAVSPYNLWTVRFLRYLTVLFLMATFLWWVLLLVSIFVSPPHMSTRGSGFFDFSFTTLTTGNLIVAVLFFASPSKALRICSTILAVLLCVDMIIVVSVPKVRAEEGWVGIASVVWATVIAAWCSLTDRVVAWGKREEEERLTGRPETRRTLIEWVAVTISTIILVIYIIIVLLITGTLIIRARDATLVMGGERYYVDGDKYQVHLACVGNVHYHHKKRGPTILLEAGENPAEAGLEPWAATSWKNGVIPRYCYWDRPGYAFSDNAPSPHSAGMSAESLSEALARAGEEGPWVLVSAGYGAISSRIFSSRHLGDVVGIMLIDPLHEDLLHRIGSPGRGFSLWGRGVLSPLGFERLGGALFKGRTRQDRIYGRNAYQGGKYIKAQLQENLVAESLTKNEVSQARNIQSKDTPLVVISSGIGCRTDTEWERKQRDITHITDNLISWDIINKAPHEVWATSEGRKMMERRLEELIAVVSKVEIPAQGPFERVNGTQ